MYIVWVYVCILCTYTYLLIHTCYILKETIFSLTLLSEQVTFCWHGLVPSLRHGLWAVTSSHYPAVHPYAVVVGFLNTINFTCSKWVQFYFPKYRQQQYKRKIINLFSLQNQYKQVTEILQHTKNYKPTRYPTTWEITISLSFFLL